MRRRRRRRERARRSFFVSVVRRGKNSNETMESTLTRQKRRRTCVAMVEKFPEYAVYSAKMVLVRSLRVAATNAYMSGMTRCVAHRKKMRTKRKAPPSLFFPTKAERNSIQIERIMIRWESETNLKSTRVKQKEKERRRRRKKEDMRMDRRKKRKHNSWSSRYYCLLTLLLAFQ